MQSLQRKVFANDNIDAAPFTDRVSMRGRNVVPQNAGNREQIDPEDDKKQKPNQTSSNPTVDRRSPEVHIKWLTVVPSMHEVKVHA